MATIELQAEKLLDDESKLVEENQMQTACIIAEINHVQINLHENIHNVTSTNSGKIKITWSAAQSTFNGIYDS